MAFRSSITLGLTFLLAAIGDFIGDLILLYRCWLVWGRKWNVVLVPFIATLGSIGTQCAVFHIVFHLNYCFQCACLHSFWQAALYISLVADSWSRQSQHQI